MKMEIMNTVGRAFNKVSFQLKKYSPEILVAVGVVGVVASTVMACKATTKVSEILNDTKENLDKIHDCIADESLAEKYTKEDSQKDLAIVYVQTGVKLAKLYAPAVALGVLSLGSILTSNNILKKRNVALAAAYATVDKSFKEYRNRVVEKFGEQVDRELKYNIKAKQIEETVVGEDGKKKKVKKTIDVVDKNAISDYARFYDKDTAGAWKPDDAYNSFFLRSEQKFANDLLIARGHVTLNDIYDRLGIERTKAGQIVGWVYNPENPVGDNEIDFGIQEVFTDHPLDDGEEYDRKILLDFNVDGNILDLL